MNVKNVKKSTGRVGGQFGNTNAEKWTEEKALEIGKKLIAWLQDDDPDHIFFEKFLVSQDLYNDVVVFLSQKYKSFSEVIKKAKQLQELKIWSLSIRGTLNVPIAIFALKNHHNRKDKVEHTGNMQSGINFQLVPRKSKKKK